MNRKPHNPGFTLIELLVAMAMMTLIVSMVYGSYAATSQSLDVHSSRLTSSQRGSLVLRLMARQIRGAYRPPAEPNKVESSKVDRLAVTTKAACPIFQGNGEDSRGEILNFITTAGLGTEPGVRRGLSRVRYRYDAHAETLSIASQPYADRLQKKDLTESWQPILRNVTAVDIEFHDGRKWLRRWSGESHKALPRAIKLGFTTMDEKDRSYRFETTVPVLSRLGREPDASRKKLGRRS